MSLCSACLPSVASACGVFHIVRDGLFVSCGVPWWTRGCSWKFSQLYFEDVDAALRTRMVELRLVYRKFSGRFALPTEPHTMSFDVRPCERECVFGAWVGMCASRPARFFHAPIPICHTCVVVVVRDVGAHRSSRTWWTSPSSLTTFSRPVRLRWRLYALKKRYGCAARAVAGVACCRLPAVSPLVLR